MKTKIQSEEQAREMIQSFLAGSGPMEICQIAGALESLCSERIREFEEAVLIHERFKRPDKVRSSLDWIERYTRWGVLADAIQFIAMAKDAKATMDAFRKAGFFK